MVRRWFAGDGSPGLPKQRKGSPKNTSAVEWPILLLRGGWSELPLRRNGRFCPSGGLKWAPQKLKKKWTSMNGTWLNYNMVHWYPLGFNEVIRDIYSKTKRYSSIGVNDVKASFDGPNYEIFFVQLYEYGGGLSLINGWKVFAQCVTTDTETFFIICCATNTKSNRICYKNNLSHEIVGEKVVNFKYHDDNTWIQKKTLKNINKLLKLDVNIWMIRVCMKWEIS